MQYMTFFSFLSLVFLNILFCKSKICAPLKEMYVEHICFSTFQGQLTEGLDVVDYLMEQPNVVPRMNPLILSTDRKYLDFTGRPG